MAELGPERQGDQFFEAGMDRGQDPAPEPIREEKRGQEGGKIAQHQEEGIKNIAQLIHNVL
jgi:hypothetical protein